MRSSMGSKMATWRAYRRHRENPEPFYAAIAESAIAAIDERYHVAASRILDLGCGPGWYLDALTRSGAVAIGVDRDLLEMLDGPHQEAPGEHSPTMALGDGTSLPFPDATFDGVVCSNLLEHTPTPGAVLREIARVLRPGGWAYVSWTPWFSPWGGHDMNPYQYLGPKMGPRLYERRHGPPRKNRYRDGLWPAHVGTTLRLAHGITEFQFVKASCRYWPRLSLIVRIPIARELLSGNCVIELRSL